METCKREARPAGEVRCLPFTREAPEARGIEQEQEGQQGGSVTRMAQRVRGLTAQPELSSLTQWLENRLPHMVL